MEEKEGEGRRKKGSHGWTGGGRMTPLRRTGKEKNDAITTHGRRKNVIENDFTM